MRLSGIYKITNIKNNKIYIGQSRDIPTRWKSHTRSITSKSNESVIRSAFAKYGLREQVTKPGIYKCFKFEILELCPEEILLSREFFYISTLKPQYNVQLMEVNPIFKKSTNHRSKFFIQYHSLSKMGYFPGFDIDQGEYSNTSNYGIFTKKEWLQTCLVQVLL